MASFLDNGLIEGVCFLKKKWSCFGGGYQKIQISFFLKVYKWKSSHERDFTQPWVTVFCCCYCCLKQWQTPPLGWRISRSGSTDELVYVNDFNDEEVCIFSRQFS